MNMEALDTTELVRFAEFSVRPELQQQAIDELIARAIEDGYMEHPGDF